VITLSCRKIHVWLNLHDDDLHSTFYNEIFMMICTELCYKKLLTDRT